MNEATLEKMKQMKFYGMHNAFKTSVDTGKTDSYTSDELIAFLVDSEHDDRLTRKVNRYIANARFRYKASIEDIRYETARNLEKNKVLRMAECNFIDRGENILITGSTGVGKSYLATALGFHACSKGYKVAYSNAGKLFARLKMAKADGTYLKDMARFEKQDVLILDDLGLQPMDAQARSILLDLVEDRHGKRPMIIASQLPVDKWYDLIGDITQADALMDRLAHNAHRFDLQGESMRRKILNKTETTTNEKTN